MSVIANAFLKLLAHDWGAVPGHDGNWQMRRWRDGRWEYRPCTDEEYIDAQYHWAIR